MTIGKRETITILCPAHLRTGGPEALHQLGHTLLRLGHDVRIVYIGADLVMQTDDAGITVPPIPDAVHPDYAAYGVPRAWRVDDQPGNAVVFPEIWTLLLPFVKRATCLVWWLSVDNGMPSLNHMGGVDVLRSMRATHLGQSWYALDWLASHGVTGQPLFDPLSRDFHAQALAPAEPRVPRILYSPKGRDFMALLRRRAPDLDWVELSGFTSEQMRGLFRTSMLHVDFGNHPGRDRMPREAALLGCCVITGRRGSAGNDRDVPIRRRYKFQDKPVLIPWILWTIRRVLAGYDRRVGDFAAYRAVLALDQATFDAQAAGIFGGRAG